MVFIRLNSISTRGGTYFENLAFIAIIIFANCLKIVTPHFHMIVTFLP
ncbi:hypothetical protein LEQ41_07810 [Streptococcus agalactiae]|nr:hypothetical protein [Streptococcus agalactiae]